jgi:hypothetical protein
MSVRIPIAVTLAELAVSFGYIINRIIRSSHHDDTKAYERIVADAESKKFDQALIIL